VVQAIGGVNYKIEGFFDVCRRRGLSGEQGVIIPTANVQHLMLRPDVVGAVERGDFHVWAVDHVDEGIEILTGLPAGVQDEDGNWPQGSINDLVDVRLDELGGRLRDWGRASDQTTTEVVTPIPPEDHKPPEPPRPPERPEK